MKFDKKFLDKLESCIEKDDTDERQKPSATVYPFPKMERVSPRLFPLLPM